MTNRDRIDAESRVPLDALLEALPGGFNGIPDIVERRAVIAELDAEAAAGLPPYDDVDVQELRIPGWDGSPETTVRVYRPRSAQGALPGILHIHGGGMIFGTLESEHPFALMLADTLGAVVVSVDYRKAPEHPFPAGPNDCYAGLVWTTANAGTIGVDPDRLAVLGGSAGGGLALSVALMARDRGGPRISYLMALYPMVDDTNSTPSSHEFVDVGSWDRAGNLEAWSWYLGEAHGASDISPYAAPARATDLSGLPPTFVDVGELDLFRDEDIALVSRMLQAGVPTELHVYPGAYHASEVFAPDAALSQRIWAARIDALARALAQ